MGIVEEVTLLISKWQREAVQNSLRRAAEQQLGEAFMNMGDFEYERMVNVDDRLSAARSPLVWVTAALTVLPLVLALTLTVLQ